MILTDQEKDSTKKQTNYFTIVESPNGDDFTLKLHRVERVVGFKKSEVSIEAAKQIMINRYR